MCRTGVSRVELLIVLVEASLLAGLFLAAGGRVREAAARMHCTNNLRQLALALDNCAATRKDGRLPPLTDLGEDARTGGGLLSVFATLIPFIEATPLYYRPEQPVANY